jgi:hypothetical protein
MRKHVFGMCVIAGLLMSVASAPLIGQGAMKEKSLYDRLGKKKAITAVVDEFVSRDLAIGHYWIVIDPFIDARSGF